MSLFINNCFAQYYHGSPSYRTALQKLTAFFFQFYQAAGEKETSTVEGRLFLKGLVVGILRKVK